MNSTILSKKKLCKCGCGKEGYIFSKGLLKECWNRSHGKPIKTVSDKRMGKDFSNTESWTNLRDELDAVFSLVVRLKDSNSDGMNNCYTCDDRLHYKNLQNGHCPSRSEMATRFLLEACRPQCHKCNSLHETKPEIFRDRLEKETPGILEYLDGLAHSIVKYSVSDLKEMLIQYRERLRLLEHKIKK